MKIKLRKREREKERLPLCDSERDEAVFIDNRITAASPLTSDWPEDRNEQMKRKR